ncbi:phospholipase A1-like [Neocloeon triangulifer]|uniref:phospholipase A1-like n=1 Tax=Neocloeon triangulifer TaxID=2078957 RepID=UPI00286F9BFC|nr:phospholipase A1-like [Neocloeon triangulifer]
MASCARLTLAHWTAAATFLVAATYLAGIPLCSGQFEAQRQLRQVLPGDMFLQDRDNKTDISSKAGCLKKNEKLQCPDPDIRFYLYVGTSGEADEINTTDPEWFAQSQFNPDAPTVMLMQGGGDSIPIIVLKNAYIKRGIYNLISVDYGPLVTDPCYVQAVNNLKPAAKCISHMISYFQLNKEKFTCVGFSLGAHVCGLIDNYVTEKLRRIIALDPARPLLSNRRDNEKLDPKDAQQVVVVHSNTGFYGQTGSTGTIDFCVNNGAQPFCKYTKDEQLCSHLHSICYMAQSLWQEKAQMGEPCPSRCPQNNFFDRRGIPVLMGEYTPSYATGSFCVKNEFPPYCLGADETDPTFGDEWCCPVNKTRKPDRTNSKLKMNATKMEDVELI